MKWPGGEHHELYVPQHTWPSAARFLSFLHRELLPSSLFQLLYLLNSLTWLGCNNNISQELSQWPRFECDYLSLVLIKQESLPQVGIMSRRHAMSHTEPESEMESRDMSCHVSMSWQSLAFFQFLNLISLEVRGHNVGKVMMAISIQYPVQSWGLQKPQPHFVIHCNTWRPSLISLIQYIDF